MSGRLRPTRRLLAAFAALALAGAGIGGALAAGGGPQRTPDRPAGLNPGIQGFSTDFSNRAVPLEEFVPAGPGKDGIPAIDRPRFTTGAAAAAWIEPREPVVEVEVGGEVRLYPIQILVWHEIVNDEIGGLPVAVTFCPLCNAAVAFDRRLGDRVLELAVSGVLRNSDLVMFDRATETWWQQWSGEGLVGELAGEVLDRRPAAITAFEDAVAAHPDARVLSRDTGFGRPYGSNPYPGYDTADLPPLFPVESRDDRLRPRERVVFLDAPSGAVAIPFAALESAGRLVVDLGGRHVEARWIPRVTSTLDDTDVYSPFGPAVEREEAKVTGSADVRDATTGERVVFDTPFWFAVAAFRPDVRIAAD